MWCEVKVSNDHWERSNGNDSLPCSGTHCHICTNVKVVFNHHHQCSLSCDGHHHFSSCWNCCWYMCREVQSYLSKHCLSNGFITSQPSTSIPTRIPSHDSVNNRCAVYNRIILHWDQLLRGLAQCVFPFAADQLIGASVEQLSFCCVWIFWDLSVPISQCYWRFFQWLFWYCSWNSINSFIFVMASIFTYFKHLLIISLS